MINGGTLNGTTATTARVALPAWGVWYADVKLGEELTLERGAAARIEIADAVFVGSVLSGGPWQGSSLYRIAGGGGRWGTPVAGKDYVNDAGVRVLTLVKDAIEVSGESFDLATVPDRSVGRRWTREAGAPSRVLELVSPEAWFVGEDGVTRLGRRPRVEYPGDLTVQNLDRERGVLEIAAVSIVKLVPGVVVEGLEASDVQHSLTPDGIRTTIWAAGGALASRRLRAWRELFRQLFPDYRYRGGPYEFRVVSQTGERVNLQPVRTSLGLPNIARARIRPGLPGCRAELKIGSVVLVAFVNADPARAEVVGFEDADGPGFMPMLLELGADGPTMGVARIGDTVQAGPFSGVITSGSLRVKAGM